VIGALLGGIPIHWLAAGAWPSPPWEPVRGAPRDAPRNPHCRGSPAFKMPLVCCASSSEPRLLGREAPTRPGMTPPQGGRLRLPSGTRPPAATVGDGGAGVGLAHAGGGTHRVPREERRAAFRGRFAVAFRRRRRFFAAGFLVTCLDEAAGASPGAASTTSVRPPSLASRAVSVPVTSLSVWSENPPEANTRAGCSSTADMVRACGMGKTSWPCSPATVRHTTTSHST
jgi:hypothetical protein